MLINIPETQLKIHACQQSDSSKGRIEKMGLETACTHTVKFTQWLQTWL
jgi:hypothetical protein